MARANLLNTRTAGFTDLIGNGRAYRVPPFQRSYSWTEEQWEDLWSDIDDLRHHPEERHYMGALVVEAVNEREFLIIDGQQRLTTLSILALAVIDRLQRMPGDEDVRDQNRERAALLRRQFIGDKDPASLTETSKLTLGEANSGFYHDYLVQLRQPANPRGLTKSNRLLWQCFQWFASRLSDWSGSGQELAQMLDRAVGMQLLFILITVDDELNAYTVFETLNARGLELSTSDLLKNWLFSRVRVATDREVLQRRWDRMLATVREERFTDFLRYHLLCEKPKIRKERLFKLVRDRTREAHQVFELMDALEARSELFAALDDPAHEYWIDLPGARTRIRELMLFRTRQVTPVLFAAWDKLSGEDFVRVLRLVSVLSFRHTLVGERNTNELEPIYHHAARALLDGTASSPAAVFELLRPIYVEDDRFRDDFSKWSVNTRGTRKRLAKYVLCRLESDLSGHKIDSEVDAATIEHILPENPDERWDAVFPRARQLDFVYRVGNLSLLESTLNRRVGNGPLADKRETYRESVYQMTRQLATTAPEEWTSEALAQRQRRMAARAVHLWRSDFA